MKTKQMMSQRTSAVGPLVALGELLLALFKVFIMHKSRVSKSAKRPGIASLGTTKLIWNLEAVTGVSEYHWCWIFQFSPKKQTPKVLLGKLFQ